MRSTCMAVCVWLSVASAMADEQAAAPVAATQVAAVASATKPSDAPASKGEQKAQHNADTDAKALSGMSILGNQEAPKALVIVPWKSSQLGDPQGISKQLDDGRQPVDRDVFMRELSYYEIRTGQK